MFYVAFGKLISRITRLITTCYIPSFLRPFFFKRFSRMFGVNLDEVEKPLKSYKSFDAFFTRQLKDGVRTIDRTSLGVVSPVDAVIQEHGPITDGQLIQAKGVYYSVQDLLPGKDVSGYRNGYFITFYLAPHDCHRIFSPVNGEVTGSQHVAGALFPVREPHISRTTGLYVKNERLTSFITTPHGNVSVVKVGAFNVGTISLAYKNPTSIQKGDHLGTFHLGSTVVLLFETGMFRPDITSQAVQYGQHIGTISTGGLDRQNV